MEVLQYQFLTSATDEFRDLSHATAASFPGKELLVPFKLEDEWTPGSF